MECEFEEKQYEQLLNFELGEKRKIFPAGQVLENAIGIDVALYSRNVDFWKLWRRFPRLRSGMHLTRELWDSFEGQLDSGAFPKFKCNIFIQHKRPEFISSPLGKEYDKWKHQYYRYDVVPDQQGILQRLEQKTSKNAIVVYACGAFHEWKDLWHFSASDSLVENSNFARPRSIDGHERYTFVRAGRGGIAFSEAPEKIPPLDFLAEVDARIDVRNEFESNVQFIITLSRQIDEVVEEFPEELGKIYSSMMQFMEIPEHELARSVRTILTFTFLTNVSWLIIYE